MPNNDDYKVGYKKPPLHSRIRPGEKRNPRGRPRGSKNVNTIIGKVMDAPAEIRENGKSMKVTRTEVIVLKQVKKAVEESDTKAAQFLLEKKIAIDAAKAPETDTPLARSDMDLIEDYKRRFLEDEAARIEQEGIIQPAAKPQKKKKARKNEP